jgi:hypothetical protein
MSIQERTVTIRKDEGFSDYMSDHGGHSAFLNALGYLMEWNMWQHRFDTVTIVCSMPQGTGRDAEISASYHRTEYSNANGCRTATVVDRYFICAIFHREQHTDGENTARSASFSFHS